MGTFLTLLSALTLAGMADNNTTSLQPEAVSIRYLTENKKVIPLYWQCGPFWTTNIKLPDLVLTNHGLVPVTPCDIEIVGMSEGNEVVAIRVPVQLVQDVVRQVNAQFIAKFGKGMLHDVSDPSLALGFGDMALEGTQLSKSETLNPGESGVILLSYVLFFNYTGLTKIDHLQATVAVQAGTKKKSVKHPIRLTPYQSKGDYIFPLKGDLYIVNLPMNLVQHRKCRPQEFGIDVQASGPNTHREHSTPPSLSDYAIFHREVMAVGHGIIAEIGDKFPESLMSDPTAYSEKQFEHLTTQLAPKIGFLNAVAGNYVIIDHENGEFSAYAHLSEGSIRVKVGDRVAQGDVIASVGNTGESTEPHLHFHLMDSKDFLRANGLPVMFNNIPPTTNNTNCKTANSLFATDYVMLRIDR